MAQRKDESGEKEIDEENQNLIVQSLEDLPCEGLETTGRFWVELAFFKDTFHWVWGIFGGARVDSGGPVRRWSNWYKQKMKMLHTRTVTDGDREKL